VKNLNTKGKENVDWTKLENSLQRDVSAVRNSTFSKNTLKATTDTITTPHLSEGKALGPAIVLNLSPY
jgi:hypothetical protein